MIMDNYAITILVRVLDRKPINGIDKVVKFNIGDVMLAVKLDEETQILRLTASGFATEDEAKRFVPKLIHGLYNMALEDTIAFEPTFDELKVFYFTDPEMAATNVFGGSEGAPERIHGAVTGEGFYVHKKGETILISTGSKCMATVSTAWANVERSIIDCISGADHEPSPLSDPIASALDLYLAHFRETTIRAKLLTLVSSLELLSQGHERPKEVRDCIKEFARTLQAKGKEADEPGLNDSFIRAANYLQSNAKQESIKEAVRSLAKRTARGSDAERLAFVKQVAHAYDIRSQLSHGNDVQTSEVNAAFKIVLYAVRQILQSAIGVKEDKSSSG